MTTPTRRAVGRPPRHTPEQLRALVTQEFLRRGYDATSMEHLAAATGLSKSALYHHARGKEALLREAVATALEALFAVLREPAARTGPAVDRLEHVLRRSVEVLVAELPSVTLLLRVRGNTETERWALQRRREFDRRLARLVQQAVDEGDLRADLDPALVTRLLFGMVNSLVEWYRPGYGEGVPEAVVALAFDGLRGA
jgi:AcrR family transcriptional regulator